GRWAFPAIVLPPGGYVVAFASEKGGRDPAAPLHTNFRLTGDGEYLALVMPDALTIVDAYDPAFPPLDDDLSHGVTQSVERLALIATNAPVRFHVPAADEGGDWTALDFDDALWSEGVAGLGYADAVLPAPGEAENLALGRPVAQTSTLSSFIAELGVDGNLGNFTHTLSSDQTPTWEVDLGSERFLSSVVLHNRTSCCGSRLRDITVEVLDADGEVVHTSALLNPENVLGNGLNGPATLTVDYAEQGGVVGQTVRVQRLPDLDLSATNGQGNGDEPTVLSLGEVEVFGGGEAAVLRHVRTDVRDAMGDATSLFVRIPFTVDDPATLDALWLQVAYDAGFVAWINGVPVAARNAPDPLGPEAAATAEPPEVRVEQFAADAALAALVPGRNVLAIQALAAPGDGDFVIAPQLDGLRVDEGPRRFFRTPTPGAPNDTPAFDGFAAPPEFDHRHGFADAPFVLTIRSATPEATIRFTLDGSAPDADSPVYAEPLAIDHTTVVRAYATREGYEDSPSATGTWVFVDDIVAQDEAATLAAGFPPMWGGTGADYGMDPDVIGAGVDRYDGRYVASIRDSLRAVPSLAISARVDDLFGVNGIYTESTRRGVAWERPISFELLYPDGRAGFQVNCGLRIQGGAFRSHGLTKKHSLRVLFKGIYGPTKLRYPLFGADAPDALDTFTLRANSNDGWQWAAANGQPLYVRDSFGRETMLAMGGVASHETFMHVYLNGIYWGVYNPVERPDAAFSAFYYGGDKTGWDAVSNDAAADGDVLAYQQMLGIVRGGVADLDAWYSLQGLGPDGAEDPDRPAWIDLDNLIDYMLTNIYVGNTDWPQKNWWTGRPRDGSSGFRFYMWDSEWSMGIRSDLNTNRVGVDFGVATPWAALLQNPEFRLQVADHVRRHFWPGGALYVDPESPAWDPEHPERNVPAARFARLADRVELALVAESARWGDQHAAVPYTVDEHWLVERDRLLADYFPARTARVFAQLRDAGLYPATPAPDANRAGDAIELTAEAGMLWFTLDGTDPRLPGGAIAPAAQPGDAAIVIALPPGETRLRARALDGADWSALFDATWQVQGGL
ncbi:MAG: CotH kinase family protein, partial [Myxococcales bacterium]|nr:CotH kinase family protein [Myxococcales bacterium]